MLTLRWLTIAATLCVAANGVQAQRLPAVAPDALAARLAAGGVKTGLGFRMLGPMRCKTGSAQDDWAHRCTAAMTDAARGGRTAALEVMIFRRKYDFPAMDAKVKAAVARLGARWQLEYQPAIALDGNGRKIKVEGACHQGRGTRNSAAFCLTPIGENTVVFTQVAPAETSSSSVTTSQRGGSDSFDDMAHAGMLASMGAVTVAEALDGGATRQARSYRPPNVYGTR